MVMFNSINFPLRPISDVQPFTYRDSRSFLDLFEQFREYLNDTVITGVNDAVKGLIENYQAAIDKFQELYGEDVERLENIIKQFKTDTQAIVDTINNKSSMIDVQHLNLTNDAVINLNVTWPKNLPVLYVITQDSFGNHNVTMGNDITGSPIKGTPFISKKPLSVTFLYLMPISGTGSFFAYTSDDAFHANFIDPTSNTRKDFDSFAVPINQSIEQIAADYKAADTDIKNLLSTNVANINAALDDRYTKSKSDIRFEPFHLVQNHAVFIGSSNATAGTWPETFCQRNNLTCHNYSLGGGSFTGSAPGRMDLMISTAINDKSYNHDATKYVFICDAGNDIRGQYNVSQDSDKVFALARNNFPLARIVMIPALWGITEQNTIESRMRSVTTRFNELNESALKYAVEVIPYSWTWHFNTTNWMKPGEVHYTPEGYSRIIYFVEKYLRGESTDSPIGWSNASWAGSGNVDQNNLYLQGRRDFNEGELNGSFKVAADLGLEIPIAWMPVGCRPYAMTIFNVFRSSNREVRTCVGYSNGEFRSFGILPADTYYVDAKFPVF